MENDKNNTAAEEIIGHLPVFRHGQAVRYGNNNAVVDYVLVRDGALHVRLFSHDEPVLSEKLQTTLVPFVWRKRA